MYYAIKRKNEGEKKGRKREKTGEGERGGGRVSIHPSVFVFSFDIKVEAGHCNSWGKTTFGAL